MNDFEITELYEQVQEMEVRLNALEKKYKKEKKCQQKICIKNTRVIRPKIKL